MYIYIYIYIYRFSSGLALSHLVSAGPALFRRARRSARRNLYLYLSPYVYIYIYINMYIYIYIYTIDGNMYNLPLYIVAQGRSGSYPVSG